MSVYVIVGASRGLGYEYLKQLSRNSSNTVIGIVRTPSTAQAKAKADNLPSNVHILPGDLTDVASLNAAAAAVSKLTNGVVDYLIVNGVYPSEATAFMDPSAFVGKEQLLIDELNASMKANVAGPLFTVNAFIELVKKSSVKKVIVISSGMADGPSMQLSEVGFAIPYATSKAAVNVVVSKMATEWKKDGVIFLALSPGLVSTAVEDQDNIPPEVQGIYDMFTEKFRKYEPNFKGPLKPEESVALQLKVIDKITMKDSGEFLSHWGNKRWV